MANFKPTLQRYKHFLSLITAVVLAWASVCSPALAEKTERYVVKKGDTLWDISKRFLNDPWLWPEVWHINPKIRNPHLIYPGDAILLYYVDGKPYLTLEGKGGLPVPGKDGIKTVRLSPKPHIQPLERAITTLPHDLIAPFLKHSSVVTEEEDLERAPYIVSSFEEHLIAGADNKVYVMGLDDTAQSSSYTVVRPGVVYRDPDSDEILGYEALHVADARLIKRGEPATMMLGKTVQEVLKEDRLLPYEEKKPDYYYFPSAPSQPVEGRIIAVLGGVSLIGQYSVVVLNKGENDGLAVGHILAIYQDGAYVRDTVNYAPVKLPDERAGLLMVFRTFEKVSYALVLDAERTMAVLDRVGNP